MMRLFSFSLGLVLLISIGAICSGQSEHQSSTQEPSSQFELSQASKDDQEIYKQLDQKIDLICNEKPWYEIEIELEKRLSCNIVLTRSAQDDSLTDDEPFTEQITGLSAKNAMRLMLVKKNATFVVQDDVIKIISLDDVGDGRYATTHYLNVRPLLAMISKHDKSRIGQPRLVTITKAKADGTPSKEMEVVGTITAQSLLLDLLNDFEIQNELADSAKGKSRIQIIGGYAVIFCHSHLADGLKDYMQDLSYYLSQD